VTRIAILGGGSWGTALAVILSQSPRQHDISVWVHDAALAEAMHRERENRTYLPGVVLPQRIRIDRELDEALAGAEIVLGVMPSAYARAVYRQAAGHVAKSCIFVSATKGLEPATHKRVSQIIEEVIPPSVAPRIAVLSGPSFAAEAARGEPTAVVLASRDAELASQLQEDFAAPHFRLYTNDDVLGVELAGAMKNVIAIAAGVCQGLGLGRIQWLR
jgi:glycerol-3-phosphate dehydrogenase (NAD(P)+)